MTRGEIWRVNLDPTIGGEIRKSRPCVVVSSDEMHDCDTSGTENGSGDEIAMTPFPSLRPITRRSGGPLPGYAREWRLASNVWVSDPTSLPYVPSFDCSVALGSK